MAMGWVFSRPRLSLDGTSLGVVIGYMTGLGLILKTCVGLGLGLGIMTFAPSRPE